jgi:hypothetical protein
VAGAGTDRGGGKTRRPEPRLEAAGALRRWRRKRESETPDARTQHEVTRTGRIANLGLMMSAARDGCTLSISIIGVGATKS